MKKSTLSAFALLAATALSAQKLECNNPFIRAGESFQINIDLKSFEKELEDQLPEGVEYDSHGFGFQSNFDLIINEPGQHTIGPFTFDWNGTPVSTNEITVTILPALEPKEALFVNYIELPTGEHYLITEEFIEGKTDEDDFVGVEGDQIEGMNLRNCRMLTTSAENDEGTKFSYRKAIYIVSGSSEYQSIDEGIFDDDPDEIVWQCECKISGGPVLSLGY